jgi:Ran GTPase-activating protein (RanGAP) involved in mRNA processing and transport
MDSTTGPPGLTHPLLIENFAWVDFELERRDTAFLKPMCPLPLKWFYNRENISLECLEPEQSPYPETRQIRLSATGDYYTDDHYELDYSESESDIYIINEEEEGLIMYAVSDDEYEEGEDEEDEGEDEEDEEEGEEYVEGEGEEEMVGEGLPFEQVLW